MAAPDLRRRPAAHHALRPQWPRHAFLAAIRAAGRATREPAVGRPRPPAEGFRHVSEGAELVRGAGLVKRFGGIVANDAVDFVVAEGDLIGLIGPNGSGKTTLINVLTGHLEPDEGDVLVRGEHANGRPPHIYAAMGIARTFQLTQLFGRMTVLENMLVPGLTRPHSSLKDVARRARDYLDFLSLAHLD